MPNISKVKIKLSTYALELIMEWASYELGWMQREAPDQEDAIAVIQEIIKEVGKAIECIGE